MAGLFALALGALRPPVLYADMQFQAFDAKRHSRFYVGRDRAFLGDEQHLDFSGVGRSAEGADWATMISPQYFLSAAHAAPGPGTRLIFVSGNVAGKGRHEYVVRDGAPIVHEGRTTDLFLGRLTEPIPAAHRIAAYPIFALPRELSYRGSEILVYGRPDCVGRNYVDRVGDYEPRPTKFMYFAFDTQGGCGPDDAYPRAQDSGAPSFVIWKGALALVGIHSGNSTRGGEGVTGSLAADVFLPYYVDDLNAAMHDAVVDVVPVERDFFRTPDAADRARQRKYFYAIACGMIGLVVIAVAIWLLRRPAPFD